MNDNNDLRLAASARMALERVELLELGYGRI